MRKYFESLSIFLILSFTPVLLIIFMIHSWTPQKQNQEFLKQKVGANFNELLKDEPVIRVIKDESKLPKVDFSDKIQNGDYIFLYKAKPAAVFIDPKSKEILGVTVIK